MQLLSGTVKSGIASLFLCAGVALTVAQTPTSPATSEANEPTPTFRSSSRLVVVDVVVANREGKPISGLKKEDFNLLEDGKDQTLQVFEPHVPVRQPGAVPDLHLGPGEYTNFPKLAANSAINVILFDILNTPTEDQISARQQMIEFLKTLPRGQRVALFTLGHDLRMLTGFTTSTEELIAAAYKLRPGVSPLLDTDDEKRSENHTLSNIYSGGSPAGTDTPNLVGGGNPAAALGTGGSSAPLSSALKNTADVSGAPSMSELMQDFVS
ncbi:MAG TPA: VWA domain-containing protein, partial [Terracidiphilus sp.]